ncbi:MAG: hypothetical protein AMXMBFR61_10510 [Fimbriimonadales bacterium]
MVARSAGVQPANDHIFVNVNEQHRNSLSVLESVAVFITERVGSMGFFLLVATWTLLWLSWNLSAPKSLRFDPPMAFVLWLFISNMIQILLMPLIMVGQNLQGRHAELRAENDYRVNLKTEREVRNLLHRLERQEELLRQIADKLELRTR